MPDVVINLLRIAVPSLYLIVSAGYVVAFLGNRPAVFGWVRTVLLAGVILHAALIAGLIAGGHGFPITTVFRGLLFCTLVLAVFILAAHRHVAEPAYGAFLFPITFGAALVACLLLNRGTPLPLIMQSYYFVVHVSLLFSAYSCFLFSFMVSVMYLVQHHAIRSHALNRFFHRLPSLEHMDRTVMRADALGLMLLLTGIALGFLWAFVALGSAQNLTMKIGLAILTAIVYAAEHVVRFSKGWEGQRACLISVLGFLLVLCTLLAGRHGF